MANFKQGEHYFDALFDKHECSENRYSDIEFEECLFTDCDFSGKEFQHCKFVRCEFIRCNLSLIALPQTKLFGVTFQESKLIGIDWTKIIWAMYHLDFELKFERCILNDSSFFGLTLNELVFDECKLHDVDFREGDFSGSIMNYCDFTHSIFMRTNLQHVDFSESTNYTINVLENRIKGAKFSRFEALSLLDSLDIELVD